MNFCTYFDINYAPRGWACLHTLKAQSATSCLFLLALDDQVYEQAFQRVRSGVVPIRLSDVEKRYPTLLSVKGTRAPREYYATISPILPLYLFDVFGLDKVFYTDADMGFWSPPEEIDDVFGNYSLMVTDQGFEPPYSSGRFNVGILGYRNDPNCREFLEWWMQRCLEWCKWETTPDGKCADQGYLNILHDQPNRFRGVLSCPQPGVNLGPWSLARRRVARGSDGYLTVDDRWRLVCYHYHGVSVSGPSMFNATGWKHTAKDVELIYEPYFEILTKAMNGTLTTEVHADPMWDILSVVNEHDAMNRKYFEDGIVGSLPHYKILGEALGEIVKSSLRAPLTCLDVGCGAGWQSRFLEIAGLAGKSIVYEGLDVSEAMCQRAVQNCPNGSFYVCDVLDFSPPKRWDIAMACGVIELFPNWELLLRKLAELTTKWVFLHKVFLTDGATCFERVPTYNGLEALRAWINYDQLQGVMYASGFVVHERYDWNDKVSSLILRKST